MAIESSSGETLDTINRRDTAKLLVQVGNDDGSIRDITNDVLVFEARYKIPDVTPIITKSSSVVTEIEKFAPTQGMAYIYIRPSDTDQLTKRTDLQCQLEITDSNGDVDTTMFVLPVAFRQ